MSNLDIQILLMQSLVNRAKEEFLQRFSASPNSCAVAPGRVNLIGEHVDYNDGFVLPMAIERFVAIAWGPAVGPDNVATFHSSRLGQTVTVDLASPVASESGAWRNYIAGVVAEFLDRGIRIPKVRAVIESDIPLGGGLSSSAALEVATATMLESLVGMKLEPVEKSLLCQSAEHRFAGVPCGIMDQFSSVFGRPNEAMLIDCQTQTVQPVSFESNDVAIVIANSRVNHGLVDGQYASRRAECDNALRQLGQNSWRDVSLSELESKKWLLNESEFRRARHVVTEIPRTVIAADSMGQRDWLRFGQLMYESHASLQHDYQVSCDELDILVQLAKEIGRQGGVFGSRMTGGGFGGCTVSLVKTDHAETIMAAMGERYEVRTGIKPHIFVSRPAHGAQVISI